MEELTKSLSRAAWWEVFLRLADRRVELLSFVLNVELSRILEGSEHSEKGKRLKLRRKTDPLKDEGRKTELPDRLKRRLAGEIILEFDRELPVHIARITQIDERVSRILVELLFLVEDIDKLPSHLRGPVLASLTGGKKDLISRLRNLSSKSEEKLEEWMDIALKLAEAKVDETEKKFKVLRGDNSELHRPRKAY